MNFDDSQSVAVCILNESVHEIRWPGDPIWSAVAKRIWRIHGPSNREDVPFGSGATAAQQERNGFSIAPGKRWERRAASCAAVGFVLIVLALRPLRSRRPMRRSWWFPKQANDVFS